MVMIDININIEMNNDNVLRNSNKKTEIIYRPLRFWQEYKCIHKECIFVK